MKKYLFVFILPLIFFYSSCKEKADIVTSPTLPVVYGKTLAKVFELDTTKTAPADTINRWVFLYDNVNRLIKDSFSSTNLYPGTTFYNINKIEYTGTDTFAYRKMNISYTASSFLSIDTVYYRFTNGKLESDTTVFDYGAGAPKGTARNRYSYQTGLMVRSFQNWIPQSSFTATENHRIYLSVANNDIISQRDTIFTVSNGVPQSPQIFVTDVIYLNNPNPFYKVTIPYGRGYFNKPGIGNLINRNYAPQNLISTQTSTMGNISYEYTFRTDSYPLIARSTLTENGVVRRTKLLFVYQ